MGRRLLIARPGSGGKPKKRLAAQGDAVAIYLPRDLNGDERLIWRRWAPAAILQGTLTQQTISGFRLLVECEVERRRMKDQIDHDGVTVVRMYMALDGQERIESITPHPLLPAYTKQQKQVESLLDAVRGLAAFGKAEPALPAAAPANPWANLGK